MTASTASSQSAGTIDRSEFRYILASGTKTGLLTAAAVIVYLTVSKILPAGVVLAILQTIVVLVAAVAATLLPGYWAVARTTQGVASAAAIALWGTVVFMIVDIILLRPLKAYPWTWDAVGGGSTWWYLPIWWMLGTFVAWLGALVTAKRAGRGGDTAIRGLALPMVLGGIGGALGLGISGVVRAPVGAGIGFLITLVMFALIATLRRG